LRLVQVVPKHFAFYASLPNFAEVPVVGKNSVWYGVIRRWYLPVGFSRDFFLDHRTLNSAGTSSPLTILMGGLFLTSDYSSRKPKVESIAPVIMRIEDNDKIRQFKERSMAPLMVKSNICSD